MELQFKGIVEEEKELIPLLPAWAYSKEEIKELLEQYISDQEVFILEQETHIREWIIHIIMWDIVTE